MNATRVTSPRRYVYRSAIHRIEGEQLRFDSQVQDDVDRCSRDRRAALRERAVALRQAGAQLFGPDDPQGYPRYLRELADLARPPLALTRDDSPQCLPDPEVIDAPSGPTALPNRPALRVTKTKGWNVATLMAALTTKNSDAVFWTLREWASVLLCSPGTIGGLPFWKHLTSVRAAYLRERAEKADQSVVRPKGGRSRRQSNRR